MHDAAGAALRGAVSSSPERRAARQWLGLALSVLLAAGLCALAVVIGRMPPFDRFVTDPLFFKRCLVAHVNFALIAWFYSFTSALLFLIPGTAPSSAAARLSPAVAAAGVLLMIAGAAAPGAQPVLSNYIPTIDHGLFQAGQLAFGLAVLLSLLDLRLLRGGVASGAEVPAPAATGVRAAAAGLVLAAITFAVSWIEQTPGLAPDAHYELLFWGMGHVLQLVIVMVMLSVWVMLLTPILGETPLSTPAARGLFLALLLPWLISPVLALEGTSSPAYRAGHTHLMQWGIFPLVGIFLVLCIGAIARARRRGRIDVRTLADPRMAAFLVSAGLTVAGFVLGALIRGSTTMVPAHYHASVGAVTVAFMAATPRLLGVLGSQLENPHLRRLAGAQPLLYGAGMALFAAGFALAGAHGMGRKAYGAEQAARTWAESVGLTVMGVGGFVAAAGGIVFLCVAAWAWRSASGVRERTTSPLAVQGEVVQ
ncbi:MAG: cbb3-type cytochrome c oxidase subunit I [Deltaproteobacteria bacterium]|nr:cbb3-type cytochrome c oxidase subunit I [Deltaproteobacteria bacterium]